MTLGAHFAHPTRKYIKFIGCSGCPNGLLPSLPTSKYIQFIGGSLRFLGIPIPENTPEYSIHWRFPHHFGHCIAPDPKELFNLLARFATFRCTVALRAIEFIQFICVSDPFLELWLGSPNPKDLCNLLADPMSFLDRLYPPEPYNLFNLLVVPCACGDPLRPRTQQFIQFISCFGA